jgi:MFS transporter, DHA2 family, multidrug resistance protein
MASNLTADWATDDFLPSQILQAIGQSFALTAVIVLVARSIVPAEALTIGCLLQLSRLFGGEIGNAFMQTFVRVREQVHSNLVGLHVANSAGPTLDRLAAYAGRLGAYVSGVGLAATQASKLLANAVAVQANVPAYQDGFAAAAVGAFACLALIALMHRGPRSIF